MIIPINSWLSLIASPKDYRYAHCLLIEDERRVLIDSSCGPDNIKRLQAKNIELILHSHFHEDHILGNAFFSEAEVWAHEADAPAICSLDTFMKYYGFNLLGAEAEARGWEFVRQLGLQASRVDKEFKGGELYNFGQSTWQIVHTPGHSPGHVAFYCEKQGILFSGDIDLSSFGPWYGHICSDIDDFIKSIDLCLEIAPAMLISAHKGIFTENINEKLKEYKSKIFKTEQAVLQALQVKPQSLDELADKYLYYGALAKEKADTFLLLFEKMALLLHLERLLKMQAIKQNAGIYYL